jgi:hypothetical protein
LKIWNRRNRDEAISINSDGDLSFPLESFEGGRVQKVYDYNRFVTFILEAALTFL